MALKYVPQFKTTTLNVGGGIDASQTTGIVIQSVTGVDIAKAGIVCIGWADPLDTASAEWISYTSIDGSNELQGVTRGAEGSTGKAHANNVAVAFPISKAHINELNDQFETGGIGYAQITTPSNPATNRNKLYFKSDELLYSLTDAGTESVVGGTKATGAEVTTGTDDVKFATSKALADADVNTRVKSQTGSLTRDLSAATGNVAYTGVGFVPTSIVFFSTVSTKSYSYGASDSDKNGQGIYYVLGGASGLISDAQVDAVIYGQAASSNYQVAKVATYDADGFTLTWTKTNTPTGTLIVSYIAYR